MTSIGSMHRLDIRTPLGPPIGTPETLTKPSQEIYTINVISLPSPK